jgi:tetratricopeptide (TPR) repeat protein
VAEAPPEPVVEAAPTTIASTEGIVLNSEEAPVSDETTFNWNSVNEVSVGDGVTAGPATETGFSFEAIVAEEIPSGVSAAAGGDGLNDGDRIAALLRQELESVDFYISQGYLDIAIDTLDLLEQQCGSQPEIVSRRRQIQKGQGDSPEAMIIEHGEVVIPNEVEPPRPAAAPVTVAVPAASNNGASQTTPGIDAGLAEIFDEYRASSESDHGAHANGDYETHYNLGLAYKEMDLFEDALEEFQIAVNLTSPTDGTSRYLQCCNLLGHCFVQTGAPEVAVKWFAKGLGAANISQDEHMALTYEIGAAYETAGDLSRALESFTEVYGSNVTYRNVNDRVKTLKARLGEKGAINSPGAGRSEELVN